MSFVLTPRSYRRFLEHVYVNGEEQSPRGIKTREIINASLILKDPVDRIVSSPDRKMNIAFAIAEWYSFMFGIDDIKFFQQFINDYDKFSSDGQTLDGCYGTRVNFEQGGNPVRNHDKYNQVSLVIEKLRQDPSTRQAVISIYQKEDLIGAGGLNTPCTLTLQFLLRNGKLHLIANMRSSDIVKGLAYDIFVFTMVQEYIARQLDVELGQYFHNAGSLHFYETDNWLREKMDKNYRWPIIMNEMPKFDGNDLVSFRKLVEVGLEDNSVFQEISYSNDYWSGDSQREYLVGLASVMKSFIYRKDKKTKHLSLEAHDMVLDQTLKFMLRLWLKSAGIESPRHLLKNKSEEKQPETI